MMNIVLFAVSGILILSAALVLFRGLLPSQSILRLESLLNAESKQAPSEEQKVIDWEQGEESLNNISSKLGKAGFLTNSDQRRARSLRFMCIGLGALVGFWLGVREGSTPAGFLGSLIGLHVGFLLWFAYLRCRVSDFLREVLFQLPIALESIILLVESGVGILPAVEQVVSEKSSSVSKSNPVKRLLGLVYELSSHGIPLGQALEMVSNATDIAVLRHVLLHLDISSSEGGELIPSLRSLAEHAHTEWKLSVEARVRRLENLVVFPVFASVIGLMFLAASVPIVPVLELRDQMKTQSGAVNGATLHRTPQSIH